MTTNFVETDALLAILDGDYDKLYDLVRGMLPNERKTLIEAADKLSEVAGMNWHDYEPGAFTHRMETDPHCRICGQSKRERFHL